MKRDELEQIIGHPAYIHPTEIPLLLRYVEGMTRGVEIGTAYGAMTALILAYMPDKAKLDSIDPFVYDSNGNWKASPEQARESVRRVLEHIEQPDKEGRWVLRQAYSHEAVQGWRSKIDFLLIDGDHTYEAVRQDVDDWLPKLKKYGIMLLHDSRRMDGTPAGEFNRGWEGPTAVATELAQDERVRMVDAAHSFTVWMRV